MPDDAGGGDVGLKLGWSEWLDVGEFGDELVDEFRCGGERGRRWIAVHDEMEDGF